MITTQSLLLMPSSLLIVLLLHFSQTSLATNPHCPPFACGVIHNISFPFRLKGDPKNCGDARYELGCNDNVTSMYLNSHKYFVKAINYNDYPVADNSIPTYYSTMRLVDASINNDDICSFPTVSSYAFSLPYTLETDSPLPITLITCPHPLKNSSLTEIPTYCASNSSHLKYTYIKVSSVHASDVPHMCKVDLIVWTSWREFKSFENVSLSEIRQSLLYGFELHFCTSCGTTSWEKFRNYLLAHDELLLIIPLAALVIIIVGISLPVTIIIGFTGVLVLSLGDHLLVYWIKSCLYYIFPDEFVRFDYGFLSIATALYVVPLAIVVCFALNIFVAITVGFVGALLILILYIDSLSNSDEMEVAPKLLLTGMLMCIPRIIICPFIAYFLIYKFRRRRLSTFDAIESYLQGDNKLAPIRYSYSDIKKMTKGFQEKLGEGGYGSVYKGKLRSGLHVAVKLLGKSGASGRDFMNEIATIGRIHHVNVVKLVGYCAQGSKRALVYDFMPNGSLEKYLFNRDKMSSLSWDTKFDIAVGAARGIEYLHRGCDVQILHFDIKPHNILLDRNFIPKISDFGLAKFFSTDKHAVTMTACRGTIGYVAPQLISRSIGAVSYKADVYSFGMLLVEMVNLNRDLTGNNDDSSQYFPYWIYECFNQGKDIEMLKGIETNGDDSMMTLGRKMTIVALWCIKMNPDDRPSMNKVLEMLEGDVECLQIPNYPSQTDQILVNMDESESTFSTTSPRLHDEVSLSMQIIVQE